MSGWLRRIRGALGMGLTWALAWFGAGMLIMIVSLLATGSTGADVPYPLGFGALGFVAGVTFSGLVGLIGRRRSFDQISVPRFAGWGALGGLVFSAAFVTIVALVDDPTFWSNLPVLGTVFSMAGAGCAAGALAVARKAGGNDPIEAGEAGDDSSLASGGDPQQLGGGD